MAIDELTLADYQLTRPNWMRDAACAGMPADVFFLARGGSNREARATCARCDVRSECLEYALQTTGPDYGIWGGTTERERRAIRQRRRAVKAS